MRKRALLGYSIAGFALVVVALGIGLICKYFFPTLAFFEPDKDTVWTVVIWTLQALCGLIATFSVINWIEEKREESKRTFVWTVREITERILLLTNSLPHEWKVRSVNFSAFPEDLDISVFGNVTPGKLNSLPSELPYRVYELVECLDLNRRFLNDDDIVSALTGRITMLWQLKVFYYAALMDEARHGSETNKPWVREQIGKYRRILEPFESKKL